MEQDGLAFKNFLAIVKTDTNSAAKIPIGRFLSLMKAAYPKLANDKQTLFMATVQQKDIRNVTFAEVNRLLTTHTTGKKIAPSQLLTFIANMAAQL